MFGIRTLEGAKYTFWETFGSVHLLNTDFFAIPDPN